MPKLNVKYDHPLKNSDSALNILSYYICDIFKFPEIHEKISPMLNSFKRKIHDDTGMKAVTVHYVDGIAANITSCNQSINQLLKLAVRINT